MTTALPVDSSDERPGAGIDVEQGLAETLLTQGPDALLQLTTEGVISYLNPAAERLFGYSGEELIGVAHNRLLVEDDRGGFLRVLSRLGRAGTSGTRPFPGLGLHRDGRELPLEITCSLVTTPAGTSVAVAVRDTTHRQDHDAGRRSAVSLLDATLETTADAIVDHASQTVVADRRRCPRRRVFLDANRRRGKRKAPRHRY